VRLADIVGLAFSALYQQKARTILTTLGVIFGTFVLVISLSIGQGIQDTIVRESRRHDQLRKVDVWPGHKPPQPNADADKAVTGTMSDAKRRRLTEALAQHQNRFRVDDNAVNLTPDRLQAIAQVDHVEKVTPDFQHWDWVVFGKHSEQTSIAGTPADNAALAHRIVAGTSFAADDDQAVLVSEYLVYRWGFTDEDDTARVLGQKLRLEFRAHYVQPGFRLYVNKPKSEPPNRQEERLLQGIARRLPTLGDQLGLDAADRELFGTLVKSFSESTAGDEQDLVAVELPIKGVFRPATPEDRKLFFDRYGDTDVLVPSKTAEGLVFRMPGYKKYGVNHVTVTVDREENVKGVAVELTAMGLQTHTMLEFIERERFQYLMIFGGMTVVAGVALLVAALGIINTMLMSVLERTREIGVMKAVGASDWHLMAIFLLEGALIGTVGGGLGLLAGWLASKPTDSWMRSMITRELKIELTESLFAFPLWLTSGCVVFAVLITTIAALYPARRAARVNPITALRHE
jgi:putative ABC transport system permease protein